MFFTTHENVPGWSTLLYSLLIENDTAQITFFKKLIENWKTTFDKTFFTVAVFMDLSKVFDCTLHDRVICKLHAHGLNFEKYSLLNSYLKYRIQNVITNNTYNEFQDILSDVTRGFALDRILRNFLFLFLSYFIQWFIKGRLA